ncbi:hypothetical protein K502DRAFT_362352 [Neoconidiobolus thromboides FSU 785]|nr:hypothetical protein K502DRAFT_362352 [Neoconidiobolus thromboides FSU 785]
MNITFKTITAEQILNDKNTKANRQSRDRIKIRSKVDEIKFRIDQLERIIRKYIIYFEVSKAWHSLDVNPFKDYLTWVYEKLKEGRNESLKIENEENLVQQISNFETSLFNFISNMNKNYNKSNIDKGKDTKLSLNYGRFFERGALVFLSVIDVYSLWLPKERVNGIVRKKNPSILSYTFISILARFTIHPEDPNYNELYFNNMKKARKLLTQAYVAPELDTIIALGFLTYNCIALFDFDLAVGHYITAVRMLQTLDCEEGMIRFSTIKKNEIKKLWKGLSLLFLILKLSSPDLSSKFSPEVFNIRMPPSLQQNNISVDHKETDNLPYIRRAEMHTTTYGRVFTEVFVSITSHIQKTNMEYGYNYKVEDIPSEKYNLSEHEFQQALSKLKWLETQFPIGKDIEQALEKMGAEIEFKEDLVTHLPFKKQLKFIIAILYIFLYYPQLLGFITPVHFGYDKIQVLYRSANIVFIYYFIMHGSRSNNILDFNSNYYFETKVPHPFPHFLQSIYPIFVYLNILNQDDGNQEVSALFEDCKARALALINLLFEASKLKSRMQRADSIQALRWISYSIHRFELSEDLKNKIFSYLIYI